MDSSFSINYTKLALKKYVGRRKIQLTKNIPSNVIEAGTSCDLLIRIHREGGANPAGQPTYNFSKFSEKLNEIEKILGLERGAPLRSATVKSF